MLIFGNNEINPGKKTKFMLPITNHPSGNEIGFPMMVVNGINDGPVLLVDGGIHGDEYESGEAIRQIWNNLDPMKLKGAFVGVPVVNVPAFEAGRRSTPIDGINMNRVFPGKKDGFLTEQLAYQYFNKIVLKCDLGLDLHGGGVPLAISPCVIYRELKDKKIESKLKELAFSTGIDIIWKGGGTWGGSLNIAAPLAGIPIVTAEVGGEGRCLAEFVDQQRQLIENVMINYNMIEGSETGNKKRTIIRGTFQPCTKGGMYCPKVELREIVTKDQLLGTIINLFGDVIEEIRATCDGIIVSQRTFPTIQCGEWTVLVGNPTEE